MKHRIIKNVHNANACVRPLFLPLRSKIPAGTKGEGIRYEKKAAKTLATSISGQWFRYSDDYGPGFCQTDLLLLYPDEVYVIECKLSAGWQGRCQLTELYIPVVEVAYMKKTYGIVLAKSLRKEQDLSLVCTSLKDAMVMAKEGKIPLLHWLGSGPL